MIFSKLALIKLAAVGGFKSIIKKVLPVAAQTAPAKVAARLRATARLAKNTRVTSRTVLTDIAKKGGNVRGLLATQARNAQRAKNVKLVDAIKRRMAEVKAR